MFSARFLRSERTYFEPGRKPIFDLRLTPIVEVSGAADRNRGLGAKAELALETMLREPQPKPTAAHLTT